MNVAAGYQYVGKQSSILPSVNEGLVMKCDCVVLLHVCSLSLCYIF